MVYHLVQSDSCLLYCSRRCCTRPQCLLWPRNWSYLPEQCSLWHYRKQTDKLLLWLEPSRDNSCEWCWRQLQRNTYVDVLRRELRDESLQLDLVGMNTAGVIQNTKFEPLLLSPSTHGGKIARKYITSSNVSRPMESRMIRKQYYAAPYFRNLGMYVQCQCSSEEA